jgi:hypothetical protein
VSAVVATCTTCAAEFIPPDAHKFQHWGPYYRWCPACQDAADTERRRIYNEKVAAAERGELCLLCHFGHDNRPETKGHGGWIHTRCAD